DRGEPRGHALDAIAVAHPDVEALAASKAVEDAALLLDHDLGLAELALLRPVDLAPEQMRDELHPVADAEDRHAKFEDALVHHGRAFLVDAGGPAREDDGARILGPHLLERGVARVDLAVDLALPYAARDELRGLRAEVEDQDEVLRHDLAPTTGCYGRE